MKKGFLLWGCLGLLLLTVDGVISQEINFDYLYDDWVISDVESNEELLVLRYPKIKNLSKEEMRIVYDFRINADSILSNIVVGSGFIGCGTPPVGNYGERMKEQWSLTKENGRLERKYYQEEDQKPIYTSTFEIVQLKEGCLKLQLIDEIFTE
ncbi:MULTISPECIES: hypothetical protein [Flavobacteriaceae]|uniref:hypothetical protein n=1 Tax=Flavobacteriaceae TaxID=49546 RepID=UPI001491B682|nr:MULTISPECIES: hypothetical protein [Allomuricauda]MDC6366446.1 hypothetical protein [Muricauda sp. AC10]